jgi:dipeptidyl aminopeptidase/acylaminoacyl peptidase
LKSRFFDRLSHGLAVIAGVLSCVAAMTDEPVNCHTPVITDNAVAVVSAQLAGVPVLKSLQQRHCLKPHDRIGLFGFSAGGASVLMALAQLKTQVSAAVVINASTGLTSSIQAFERATKRPYSWTPHARQLANSSDAVLHAAQIARGNPPPALLLIHGTDDTTLTPKDAVALQEALLPYYRDTGNESRLQLTLEPGVSHDWSKADNIDGLRRTIAAWFARYS